MIGLYWFIKGKPNIIQIYWFILVYIGLSSLDARVEICWYQGKPPGLVSEPLVSSYFSLQIQWATRTSILTQPQNVRINGVFGMWISIASCPKFGNLSFDCGIKHVGRMKGWTHLSCQGLNMFEQTSKHPWISRSHREEHETKPTPQMDGLPPTNDLISIDILNVSL